VYDNRHLPRWLVTRFGNEKNPTRPFVKGTLDAQDLTPDSTFLKYATQPRMVEFVTRYFGEFPYLASLELQVSMNPSTCKPGVTSTQLIHKVFGAAGDAFFADTGRCCHYGSRMSPHRHRIALIATFTTFCANDHSNNRITLGCRLSSAEHLLNRPASWR